MVCRIMSAFESCGRYLSVELTLRATCTVAGDRLANDIARKPENRPLPVCWRRSRGSRDDAQGRHDELFKE